jgi:AraC-like DNA-binding protein
MDEVNLQIPDGFRGEKAIVTPYSVRQYQEDNSITNRLHVTHIGYYPNAHNHYRERTHGAKEFIFIYCAEGEGWIRCRREMYNLSRNCVFILPAGVAHAYGSNKNKPWSIYWIHFQGKNISDFSSIIERLITLPDSDNSRYADRFALFDEMYKNLEMGYTPENLEHISFCLQYFLASIKYLPQYRIVKTRQEDDCVRRSMLYMKEHLEEKLTLAAIAGQVGYSVSRYSALFSAQTSFSPMVYYMQLKIQRACSYLQFSDLKIKEISYRLGFFDPFHFSKIFKNVMEISPQEYRKRYK